MESPAISASIIAKNFDPDVLEQIGSMRTIRLTMAEKMLHEIDKTAASLIERGLVANGCDRDELRKELLERVATMKSRMARPDVIFADEISMYVDLVERSEELDAAEPIEH